MSEQTIQPRTRQELYDEIRKQGKEEFILSEMKRLGFWDVSTGIPKVSDALVTLKSTLQKELNTLVEKQTIYHNKQQMLKDMRADRMKKALEKRDQTKQRRIAERSQKAKAWAHTQAQNIIYLGQGVSGGLNNQESDQSKLQQLGLPVFESIKALADAMQVSLAELRFLSFARKVSQVSHYRRFSIPKKSGGKRQISAPMPRLKKAQYWILQEILYKLSVHSAAHGFVPQKSILDNARQHTGKAVVINMDLKDFFPTIHYKRVKGLFVSLGYSEQIATVLGLICTEPEIDTVEMDGQTYYVASGERFLPQGAPTSPAITNLICYRMDKRFAGMAAKAGWTYTRYADDLTFSSAKADNINRILWQTRQIIDNEGFNLHPDKLQVMRASSQQEVTGLVVNKFPNVSSEQLKQFRAVLHRIETKGWEQAKFGNGHILQSIRGFANFVNMVNPAKGAPLLQRVDAILANPIAKTTLSNLTTTAIQEKESKIAKQAALKNQQNAKDAASAPVETIQIQEADSNWWDIFV